MLIMWMVSVRNKGFEKDDFDSLCDCLSRFRHWCMDYRMVRDFANWGEPEYWHSNVYEGRFVDAVYDSVKKDVERFVKAKKLDMEKVEVTLMSMEG